MNSRGKKRFAANLCFIIALIVIFVMGLIIGTKLFPEKIKEIIYVGNGEKSISINVPGISNEGEGVMTVLTATMKKGTGQVLVNVNNVLAGYELQSFARTAVHAVQNVSGVDMKEYDVSFSIQTKAGVIDGGSASAAMAVAVLAMVDNAEISGNAAITGAIDESGKILPVGAVDRKADAARKSNMTLIVVPLGQGSQVEHYSKKACNAEESYCEITYMPYIEKTTIGIKIKEAETLKEALSAMSKEYAEQIASEPKAEEPKKTEARQHISLEEAGIKLEGYSIAQIRVAGTNIFLKSNCTAVPALTTPEQASSIENGAYKRVIGRPNAHDTASEIFNEYDIDIIGTTIDSYESGIFEGRLFAYRDGKTTSIEAKPSDSVAWAARFDAPVYVSNKILSEQGINAC